MTIEEAVQNVLISDVGVNAIVPAARIKPPGDWQNLERPYIVHFPVAVVPDYAYETRIPLTNWNYQVSCFAHSYSVARQMAVAVRDALSGQHEGVNYFWRNQILAPMETNTTPPITHIALEFDVFEALDA